MSTKLKDLIFEGYLHFLWNQSHKPPWVRLPFPYITHVGMPETLAKGCDSELPSKFLSIFFSRFQSLVLYSMIRPIVLILHHDTFNNLSILLPQQFFIQSLPIFSNRFWLYLFFNICIMTINDKRIPATTYNYTHFLPLIYIGPFI